MTPISFMMPVIGAKVELPDMLLVVGMALVTTSLLMVLRKRRRRASERLTPHEQIERMQQQRGMRGDLEDLMVEIEQLAKRVGAQLDAKSIELERGLREADDRIEQLRSLGQRADSAEPRAAVDPSQTGAGPTVESSNDPLAKAVYALADQGLEAAEIAKRLGELVGKIELILALRRA